MAKSKTFIPLSKPTVMKDEIEEVVDTLKSGWLTTGPKVIRFEEKFKNYVGSKYAVAVNSGTAALHLAYIACNIKVNDEVITTTLTYASTVNMLEVLGARPVFVDIDIKTLNIDTNKIEEKITSKTKAIVPVHFAGRPCQMDDTHLRTQHTETSPLRCVCVRVWLLRVDCITNCAKSIRKKNENVRANWPRNAATPTTLEKGTDWRWRHKNQSWSSLNGREPMGSISTKRHAPSGTETEEDGLQASFRN